MKSVFVVTIRRDAVNDTHDVYEVFSTLAKAEAYCERENKEDEDADAYNPTYIWTEWDVK